MLILRLENPIQNYDWGCPKKISELFGIKNPERLPMAEIWMGGHPKSPSSVFIDNQITPLNEILRSLPEYLGEASVAKFGSRLPFLFKVISAARPLSIQAHPDKQQAIAGFKTEDSLGISVSAFHRNYKDNNHKPELVYALTSFKAMNGFRPAKEIISLFGMASISALAEPIKLLQQSGLKAFYEALMSLTAEQKQAGLQSALDFALYSEIPAWKEVLQLNKFHPDDIGILCPLFLNSIILQPGEAMYLGAGTLHTYLEGTALEIMACSDNVLRGGLTSKHVDIPELLKTIRFESISYNKLLLKAQPPCNGETVFRTEADDFLFSVIDPEHTVEPMKVDAAEILFCIEGQQTIQLMDDSQLTLTSGQSCFICANSNGYSIKGIGKLARATAIISR